MKCDHCGDEVKANCDWRQGRCPHLPAPYTQYQARFLNLINTIKSWFK